MNEAKNDTPGFVRLTDGLGPLPEYAHVFRPRWPGDEGGFVSTQMRLYAMEAIEAERERIASWLEMQRNDIPATGAEFAAALRAHRA